MVSSVSEAREKECVCVVLQPMQFMARNSNASISAQITACMNESTTERARMAMKLILVALSCESLAPTSPTSHPDAVGECFDLIFETFPARPCELLRPIMNVCRHSPGG